MDSTNNQCTNLKSIGKGQGPWTYMILNLCYFRMRCELWNSWELYISHLARLTLALDKSVTVYAQILDKFLVLYSWCRSLFSKFQLCEDIKGKAEHIVSIQGHLIYKSRFVLSKFLGVLQYFTWKQKNNKSCLIFI